MRQEKRVRTIGRPCDFAQSLQHSIKIELIGPVISLGLKSSMDFKKAEADGKNQKGSQQYFFFVFGSIFDFGESRINNI
jgi:hypothetical protein